MRERGSRQRGAVQIALRPEFGDGRLGGRQLVAVVPARPPSLETIIADRKTLKKSSPKPDVITLGRYELIFPSYTPLFLMIS